MCSTRLLYALIFWSMSAWYAAAEPPAPPQPRKTTDVFSIICNSAAQVRRVIALYNQGLDWREAAAQTNLTESAQSCSAPMYLRLEVIASEQARRVCRCGDVQIAKVRVLGLVQSFHRLFDAASGTYTVQPLWLWAQKGNELEQYTFFRIKDVQA